MAKPPPSEGGACGFDAHHGYCMKLVEGIDYYLENGKYVFTEIFLLKRNYCCFSGCRHCPYGNRPGDATRQTSFSQKEGFVGSMPTQATQIGLSNGNPN